uniref:Carbohydrate kinase PfkB domain-containing protein n=1 Tax=Trieres chinensis TaxID=1514140 RepID=A0A7S2EFW1_TRICV|mmetsp:Transcript_22191/g.44898  ORF Transcript_22191/g.44898 Transcript_22191/m.44898 type:complete len:377 (+) Transcript_22191:81-1211(+)
MTSAHADRIICAGLSCLDLQLLGCTRSGSAESIERYDEAVYCAGGSASMASAALSLLFRADEKNGSKTDGTKAGTEVHVLTKVGEDLDGERMVGFYERVGSDSSLVLRDPSSRTSMAVLPVFADGGRGCFVNLACNDSFSPQELLGRLDVLPPGGARAFLFGYPHLLPLMRGEELKSMLQEVKQRLGKECLIGVDLNGVSRDGHTDDLLLPALGEVDVLHLNEEEAEIICGTDAEGNGDITALHNAGCAVVLLSLGSKGCRISITSDGSRLGRCPAQVKSWSVGANVRAPAFAIDGEVNANGAGDALFAGFCLGASWPSEDLGGCSLTASEAGLLAAMVARQRCDAQTRDGGGDMEGSMRLMERVKGGNLPKAIGA